MTDLAYLGVGLAVAILASLALFALLSRADRRRKPRLEVLSSRAGAEAFADQMRIERERRRDRG